MEEAKSAPARPPRGFFPARVDDKGRLKLPVNFQQYVTSLAEGLFVTTLDEEIARIYPLSMWDQNALLLRRSTTDPERNEDLLMIADHYGAEAEMDSQGRILLPTTLRRKLNLENQAVQIQGSLGRIDVFSQEVYDQRFARATVDRVAKLRSAEREGLL